MKIPDFEEKWINEAPMYNAWGDLVTSTICQSLSSKGKDINSFLKVPAKHRVKDTHSLIDKAFYRHDKQYTTPYEDIEDKVACRFIVLLIEQINDVVEIIEEENIWSFKECRHFSDERNINPLLFTYQSVHFVVTSNYEMKHNDLIISAGTTCEIQIRTLLQHAHAELTHDAVYKSKKLVEPKVHRTVAKSMALIETTDDFFSDVNQSLNVIPKNEINLQEHLDFIYSKNISAIYTPAQKSSLIILDEFNIFINEKIIDSIDNFIKTNSFIFETISSKKDNNSLYNQSIIVFIFWLVRRKKNRLLQDWPLDIKIIEEVANDLGVSLDH